MLLSGSVTGYLQALERIEDFGAQVLVPGHGEPCDVRVLDPLRRYATFVLAAAEQGHAAGLSPLQTARELDLGEFAHLLDAERIVLNLHRAYAEITGADVDIPSAFADTVAYHGGRPLRCIA
jgi:cyclase